MSLYKSNQKIVLHILKIRNTNIVQYPLGLTLEIIKVSVLGGILYCKLFNY